MVNKRKVNGLIFAKVLLILSKLLWKMEEAKFEYEKLKRYPYCSSTKIEPFLKASDRLTGIEEEFYLSKCKNCGLIFQNPRVKEKSIRLFYKDSLGYYRPKEIAEKNKTNWIKKFKEYLRRQTLINHFNYTNFGKRRFILKIITFPIKRIFKIHLTPDHIEHGTLLEIGCSYGSRLKFLRNMSWKVIGVEMDKKTSEYAREKGFNVYNQRIEKVKFPLRSFDVVLISMVLEHLYNPFETFIKITRWLKPGGQVIFSIPYIEGFEAIVFKEFYHGLHLPHHIVFLNKEIIKRYLNSLGYKNIKFYFDFFDRDMVASAYYKYLDNRKWYWKIIGTNKIFRILAIKPFVLLLSLLGKTSRVTVFTEKS